MKKMKYCYMLILLLLLFGRINGRKKDEEWDEYDDQDLALSIPPDAVGIAKEFRQQVLKTMQTQQELVDIPSNRCHCNYGSGVCGANNTCVKHAKAACFHSVEERYNKEYKRMETWHKYGCARLERGSGGSHLTCKSYLAAHYSPKSIACCYEGYHCNLNIEPPPYAHINEFKPTNTSGMDPDIRTFPIIELASGLFVAYIVILLALLGLYKWGQSRGYVKKREKKKQMYNNGITDMVPTNGYSEKDAMLYEDSGSGSGQATLIQRTVRQDLTLIKTIGQGRYGEVRKAYYRGSYVAVKTFYTTDEDSWKNERDVYQTHMINHENILQFVAADIWSEEDSMTKMLLVTDYHELGSLCDYLRREETLTTDEALRLIHSCICGIDHLHTALQGTDSYRKPEIAHRDIKSKNIIVKRAGVCCIADLGLALRYDNGEITPKRFNVQVGTKRYMAPELLMKTLNPKDFSQFKMADIYSMALVMWEIVRRVEETPPRTTGQGGQTDRSESSGYDSISDSIVRLPNKKTSVDLSLKAKPYMPPFDGSVDNDPSFDQMHDVVCTKGIRPPIENAWVKGNDALCQLTNLMRDSWHMNPQYRHSALKLKKEMRKLIELEVDRNDRMNKSNQESNNSKTDSGIHSQRDTNSSRHVISNDPVQVV